MLLRIDNSSIVKSVKFSPLNLCSIFMEHFYDFSLAEVGRLEAQKLSGNYDTGQMFLHKVSHA
jgi:hypothetical protein